MKKMTLLTLAAATMLFTACTEEQKKAATDAANSATETVKESTGNAVEATKAAAADAVTAAKAKAAEVADAAKAEAEKIAEAAAAKAEEAKAAAAAKAEEVKAAAAAKAEEAAQALKDRAAEATEAVTAAVTPENAAGKAAYAKCAGCHGADGKTKALGKANPVAGQTAEAIAEALHGYKAGTRNVSGMGMLMKGQVASMDDATIKAVSEYISGL